MAIDFFQRGGRSRLPHPYVQKRVLRVICHAIVEGWGLLKADPPPGFLLDTADEDTVTAALYNTLVNRVLYGNLVPGFTPALFRVYREPKVYTHNSRSLEKMPDLFFTLLSDRTVAFPDQDGVFAECKPIDVKHPVGGDYCEKGLLRFVNGEYAWAMREALMVGYTADGYFVQQHLKDALGWGHRPTTMPLVAGPSPIQGTAACAHCQLPHQTIQSRKFNYHGTQAAAPDILIYHVWLIRS